MVAWRVDRRHLEGQPAAVARGVAEELRVVARAAKRSDVLAVLVKVGIGSTLVDGRHGDRRLQLVQFRGLHRVQLLAAHQPILRQRQQVVAPHAVGIGLCVEILLQFRRQQVVEPRRLIRALFADEHQDDIVHHRLVHPCRHHAHQPFLQVLGKECLLVETALDADADRHAQDIVLAVPSGQSLQIVLERVEVGYGVRIDDSVDVIQFHHLLSRHLHPYRVHQMVVDGLPVRAFVLITRQQPVLYTLGHHVVSQKQSVVNKRLDVVGSSRVLLPVGLALLGPFCCIFCCHIEKDFLATKVYKKNMPEYGSRIGLIVW